MLVLTWQRIGLCLYLNNSPYTVFASLLRSGFCSYNGCVGPSSNLSASSLLLLLITSEGVKWNTGIVRGLKDRKEDVLLQGGGGGEVNHTVYSLGAENLLFCLLLFSISHMLTSIGLSLTSFLFLGLLHTHRTTHLDLRTVPYTSFNSWFFPYPILPALNVILTSSTYLWIVDTACHAMKVLCIHLLCNFPDRHQCHGAHCTSIFRWYLMQHPDDTLQGIVRWKGGSPCKVLNPVEHRSLVSDLVLQQLLPAS